MVCDEFELDAEQVLMQLLAAPHEGQCLFFSLTVAPFNRWECPAGIADHVTYSVLL